MLRKTPQNLQIALRSPSRLRSPLNLRFRLKHNPSRRLLNRPNSLFPPKHRQIRREFPNQSIVDDLIRAIAAVAIHLPPLTTLPSRLVSHLAGLPPPAPPSYGHALPLLDAIAIASTATAAIASQVTSHTGPRRD